MHRTTVLCDIRDIYICIFSYSQVTGVLSLPLHDDLNCSYFRLHMYCDLLLPSGDSLSELDCTRSLRSVKSASLSLQLAGPVVVPPHREQP